MSYAGIYSQNFTCATCGGQYPIGVSHACGVTPGWRGTQTLGPSPKPQTGWLCPACGKGNAPWAAACGHCRRDGR